MLVSICVITYQRPEGLKRLLEGLSKLEFKQLQPRVHVVVVDNDESGQAFHWCNQLAADYPWSLTACIEPQRGISYARNRAIATAPLETDFIAFIDDDEVPEPDWLEQLLLTQAEHSAHVVHGPVFPHFQPDVPVWIVQGRFFEPKHWKDGSSIEVAYTNNVLFQYALVKGNKTVFQERLALTGGEDSYFFRSLHKQGCKIVWASNATVHEWIPSSRATLKWLLQRGYRSCLTYTIWEKEVNASASTIVIATLKAVIQILWGILLLPVSLFLARHILAIALLKIWRGAGRISGLLGLRYEEYRAIHRV
ncbi:glycosyltransferase family 2 protein [Thermoleptolyngbya sp.]